MANQEFQCPNCGAPLEYTPSDSATVKCPFCNSVVIVPEELRPPHEDPVQVNTDSSQAAQPTARKGGIVGLLLMILVIILVAGLVPFLIIFNVTSSKGNGTQQGSSPSQGRLPATPYPLATSLPTLTPTPNFAMPGISFGQKGIGEGMFNDARYIAVDSSGFVYVADYEGGRIQRFDSSGKYLSQWKVNNDSHVIIAGLTANHPGDVFAAVDENIYRFNGQTGKLLSTWNNPKGGTFGDMAATTDGRLAAMWYEGRWGMITSLEGHREDLVFFDSDGKITTTLPSVISSQTDSLELDVFVAVDGTGKIFLQSEGTVYVFSPLGKYINNFGSQGDQPGQFQSPTDLAVDGQGRLYVNDRQKIHVFAPDNHFIDDFSTQTGLDMISIDAQGVIWGVGRDHITRYDLRGK